MDGINKKKISEGEHLYLHLILTPNANSFQASGQPELPAHKEASLTRQKRQAAETNPNLLKLQKLEDEKFFQLGSLGFKNSTTSLKNNLREQKKTLNDITDLRKDQRTFQGWKNNIKIWAATHLLEWLKF